MCAAVQGFYFIFISCTTLFIFYLCSSVRERVGVGVENGAARWLLLVFFAYFWQNFGNLVFFLFVWICFPVFWLLSRLRCLVGGGVGLELVRLRVDFSRWRLLMAVFWLDCRALIIKHTQTLTIYISTDKGDEGRRGEFFPSNKTGKASFYSKACCCCPFHAFSFSTFNALVFERVLADKQMYRILCIWNIIKFSSLDTVHFPPFWEEYYFFIL